MADLRKQLVRGIVRRNDWDGTLFLPEDEEEERQEIEESPLTDLQIAQAYRAEAMRLRDSVTEYERTLHSVEEKFKSLSRELAKSASERERKLETKIEILNRELHSVRSRLSGALSQIALHEKNRAEMQCVYETLVVAGAAPEVVCSHGIAANRCFRCLTNAARRALREEREDAINKTGED